MKTRLRRALAMLALIAFVVTMLPLSAFAEARTSFIRSRIDSRPARPDSGIEIVPHKTENPKRSAIWDGSIAAGFAGGSGTEDDPYLISNGSELAYLAQQVNSGNRYENVHFKLTNDIYLNDTTDWELWGTTGSSSAGKADTCDGSAIEPTEQNKGDKVDVPIAIPVRPAPKTELESDTLSDALNAAGQSNTFVSTGSYPWLVDSTTYDGRTAAKSGNHNVSSSTSSFSTTVTLSVGDIISFEYCVSSESNYDEFEFSVNDSVVLTESGVVSWNSYSYQATTDGEYTFLWSYTKDSNANGNSDACWVDNVYIGAPIAVTGIDVLEQLDIPVNGTGTVTYSVLPENAYNKNVSFESADAGIAAVNANGVVTGVSAGETTITVTTEDGGFTGACTINVYNQAVTGVTIEPSEAELTVGSSTKLTATVLPENASNKNVVYSVDDESILSVDQDGNVTGLSLGTATVTVTTEDGGFSASAEITVMPVRVTGVSISPKAASVGLGHTIQLTASIKPSNAANKNLSWSVSDETIISVDDRGIVTGLSLGTATATVTTEDGGFTASAEITVCYAPSNTWTAIGTESNCFYGCFDGNGYAVRGIYINTQESFQGLFGFGKCSVIANLGVAESYIYGNKYVGGVVGESAMGGSVTNCYNAGSVTGNEYVGGVVGWKYGAVTNCYNTGSITGSNYVGGVAGDNLGTVTDCYNMSSVTGDESVGGVVGYIGYNDGGTVTNCYYYVDCCASSNSYGTALTSEQMLRAESFEGFDFETVWTMDGNPGYPYPKLINNFQAASPTTDDVVFSIENITAAPGTDVSVAFTVEGEYEAHALTAFVRYDTNMLSVVGNGIAQGNIWQNMIAGGGTIVADAVTRPGQVPFMAIMPTNPFSGSGTIFTMNFHVNESVELGTVIPLELEIREFYYMPVQQTDPTLIPFTSDNGSITAQVYHSVTFVDYDGTVLSAQSVAHGSAAIEPTAPEREGYAFIGWDKDFSNVTEDMTVTAQYSANSYSITYTINGEEYAVRNYEYGAAVSAPEYTVPEGHTFSGWDIPETMPAQNLVLDAALTVNSYTITYTINGEEYTAQTYEFGAEVSAPEYTVPEGHTFSGWDIPETMPAENLVLDAALTVNEYTVTYNINGEIYAIQVYAYGEEVFAPAYDVPDHFTFSGWDTPATMPAENIVLDATLVEDGKYTVSFMVDGETYFTFTGYEGDVITVPEDPEKLGYTFDAWDGMPEDGVLPAANITVTAVWIVNTYTITYTVNGEEYSVRTYEYGAAIITPAYDVPEGYTFSGWDVPETMPAEDLVVDATCTINVYEVTLIDGLNGDPIAVLYVAHGQDAVLPDAPEHAGYIFDRWDGDPTNVTEDRTITACYWMIGDVNHDGEITTYDALLIMRYALGVETDGNELIMDFNGDGCVDSLDALLVLRRVIGAA